VRKTPTSARLATLESAGLIQLAALQPELEYMFRHILVKDAAYASLVREDRRSLHRVVAETLQPLVQVGGDQPARRDLLPLLAHHFAEADAHEAAADYFSQAGDAAMRVYANAEAIMHYSRAIELVGPRRDAHAQLGDLFRRRGRAYEVSGQQPAAMASYEALEALGRERNQPDLVLMALWLRATLLALPSYLSNPSQALDLGQGALQMARELGDRVAEARLLWTLSMAYYFATQPPRAVAAGEQALALARELGLTDLLPLILNDLGRAYFSTGNQAAARAAAEEARQLWRAAGNLAMLSEATSNLANSYFFAGEYDAARALLDESLAVSRSIGDAWGQSYSQMMLTFIYMEQGRLDEAFAAAQECLYLSGQAGFSYPEIVLPANLAMVYAVLGQPERGLALAERAYALADTKAPELRAEMAAVLAQIHTDLGHWPEAEALVEQARAQMITTDQTAFAPVLTAATVTALALERGDAERAAALAAAALADNEQSNLRVFLADLMVLHARALGRLGRLDDADAALRRAQGIVDSQQSRRERWVVLAERAVLADQRGQAEAARGLRDEAREVIDFMTAHLSEPELRASFLNRPAVRAVLAGASPRGGAAATGGAA
jgi:tetratricopeptide (TPR) repeat protein